MILVVSVISGLIVLVAAYAFLAWLTNPATKWIRVRRHGR